MTAGPVDDHGPVTLARLDERMKHVTAEVERIRDALERRRPDLWTILAVMFAGAALAVNAVPALAA